MTKLHEDLHELATLCEAAGYWVVAIGATDLRTTFEYGDKMASAEYVMKEAGGKFVRKTTPMAGKTPDGKRFKDEVDFALTFWVDSKAKADEAVRDAKSVGLKVFSVRRQNQKPR